MMIKILDANTHRLTQFIIRGRTLRQTKQDGQSVEMRETAHHGHQVKLPPLFKSPRKDLFECGLELHCLGKRSIRLRRVVDLDPVSTHPQQASRIQLPKIIAGNRLIKPGPLRKLPHAKPTVMRKDITQQTKPLLIQNRANRSPKRRTQILISFHRPIIARNKRDSNVYL